MENNYFTPDDYNCLREALTSRDPREDFEVEELIEKIIERTTPRQSYIIIRILEGYHLKEIAEKLKVSKSTISLEIAKIKERCKDLRQLIH